MRNLFRKKSANQQDNQSKPDNSHTSSLKFDESHPYLSKGTVITTDSIFNDDNKKKQFPKLSIWLQRHPEIANKRQIMPYLNLSDLLKIYIFENIPQDNSYHEFRHLALKTQINHGFNRVLKIEQLIKESDNPIEAALTDPPIQNLTHIIEAHKFWRKARQEDFSMQLMKHEVNEIVRKKLNEMKQVTIHLVSLLSAIDAVPLNCVPVVNFNKFDIPKENIIKAIPQCCHLDELSEKFTTQSIQSIKKIDEVLMKFDKGSPSQISAKNEPIQKVADIQIDSFKHLLQNNYLNQHNSNNLYDHQNHCLPISADSSAFHDFISHPKSITYPFYLEYSRNPNTENYQKLVENIIETFSLKQEDATLINCLCSLSFAHLISPKIDQLPNSETVNQGEQTDLMINIGFDVFIMNDPILTLFAFSNNMNVELSIEDSVKYIVECLKLITPQWKEIIKFVIDCSVQDYLPPKLRSIRYVLTQLVPN